MVSVTLGRPKPFGWSLPFATMTGLLIALAGVSSGCATSLPFENRHIVLPEFLRIVLESCKAYAVSGFGALATYDAVATLVCAIWITTCGFAVHVTLLAWRLRGLLKKLRTQ